MMPPVNESPAPTVSTTGTSLGVFDRRTPDAVTAKEPCFPLVTTTTEGPMPSQRAIVSSKGAPSVSHSTSSSETFTMSETATKRSMVARARAGSPMIEGRAFGSKTTRACARERSRASRTTAAPGSMTEEIEPAWTTTAVSLTGRGLAGAHSRSKV